MDMEWTENRRRLIQVKFMSAILDRNNFPRRPNSRAITQVLTGRNADRILSYLSLVQIVRKTVLLLRFLTLVDEYAKRTSHQQSGNISFISEEYLLVTTFAHRVPSATVTSPGMDLFLSFVMYLLYRPHL